jgi:Flp pilus assembly protein TadB
MTSYDGLTLIPLRDHAARARTARPSMPVWLPMVSWAFGLVAVVVAAAVGGPLMVLSTIGVIALLTAMAVTAVRWRHVERLAMAELAERRASDVEARLV